MPSKSSIFTPLSILFRPHHKPVVEDRFVVEAPGTEPYMTKYELSRQPNARSRRPSMDMSSTKFSRQSQVAKIRRQALSMSKLLRLGGGFCCQVPPNPALRG